MNNEYNVYLALELRARGADPLVNSYPKIAYNE